MALERIQSAHRTCRGGRASPRVDRCGWVGSCGVALCRIRSLSAGDARCGSWTFALEHETVGLTDVTVSGDGGGLVELHLL